MNREVSVHHKNENIANPKAWSGKKVVVVGLGKTGRALVRFFKENGAQVIVSDNGLSDQLKEGIDEIRELGCELELGRHTLNTFLETDCVVVSPGVPLDIPELVAAREKGIPVIGELEVAAPLAISPIIAISGTNGKTTTTELVSQMFKAGGKRVFTGGNIGNPFIEFVAHPKKVDFIILEVSSFQLDTAPGFHPHIAVLLNVTQDHLDRYPSFDQYKQSKLSIFRNQSHSDFAVINGDDPQLSRDFGFAARTFFFSLRNSSANAFPDDGQKRIICQGITLRNRDGKTGEKGVSFNFQSTRLVGAHNLENMLAASLVAYCCGIKSTAIQGTINHFPGLPHRLQFVREWKKVKFYNDSKGTNVGAVMRALESFSKPVVLLAGGRDKKGSYEPLIPLIKKQVKALILFGESRNRIANCLGDFTNTWLVEGLEQALNVAAYICKPGDVVLLSPACASFDQYKDYKERGEHFEKLVKALV